MMTQDSLDSNDTERDSESQPLLSPCSSDSTDHLLPCSSIIDTVIDPTKHVGSSNRASISDDTYIVPVTKVYFRRWWILLIFSLLGFLQSWIWITYSTISISAKAVYGWTDATIAILMNWGNIPFVFLVIPCSWLLHKKGLRMSTVISALCMFFGSGLKCFKLQPEYATIAIHIGQMLNGVAGIVFTSAPAQLSSSWFPVHQRTTATSIAVLANVLGIAFGYFIGPIIVPNRSNTGYQNISRHDNLLVPWLANNTGNDTIENQRADIQKLMYSEFGVATVLLFALLIYFPNRPALPPTTSATLQRLQLATSLCSLFRNRNFWVIALGYAITNAICSNWLGLLGPALAPFDVPQAIIGYMGTASMLAGIFLSLIFARIVDLLGGKIKMFLVVMWIVGCINFIWYTLLYLKVIRPTLAQIYPTVIIAGVMAYSGSPLYMELCVEMAYPIHEGVVGLFVQAVFNLVGAFFLLLFLIPNIGVSWMNWCLIGCTVFGVVMALLQKESYNRSNIDKAAIIQYEPIGDD